MIIIYACHITIEVEMEKNRQTTYSSLKNGKKSMNSCKSVNLFIVTVWSFSPWGKKIVFLSPTFFSAEMVAITDVNFD